MTQSLRIASHTGADLSFTIQETIPWLSVGAVSGTAGQTPFITHITVNTSSLTSGGSPYTGEILITNQTDPSDVSTVHVRLSRILHYELLATL